jgi:MSHA pilin protein MshC
MGPVSRRGARLRGGYSLVELVAVLALVALLGAVAAPRMAGTDVFAERGYYDELAMALRYAGRVAVASGCPVRMRLDAGGYELRQQAALDGHCDPADDGWTTPVRLPGGEPARGDVPRGVSVGPAADFRFLPGGETTLASDLSLRVGGRSLTVTASSGFVRAE